MPIKNFDQVFKLAEREGPKRMAVISAGDAEVMRAVREAKRRGFIEPVLIGDENAIKEISENVEFDLSGVEVLHEIEPQAMAYRSMDMAIKGEVEMQMKGMLPTSYIYRAVIERRFGLPGVKKFSVLDFHSLPSVDHLIAITDSGISINPDFDAKLESARNANFLFRILGYPKPRILALSAARGMDSTMPSAKDSSRLAAARVEGKIGDCIVEDALSLADVFLGKDEVLQDYEQIDSSKTPHILLVPNLDSGNILAKMRYLFKDVKSAHIIGGAKTPIVIPPRAENHKMIIIEIAFGVTIAHLMASQREHRNDSKF